MMGLGAVVDFLPALGAASELRAGVPDIPREKRYGCGRRAGRARRHCRQAEARFVAIRELILATVRLDEVSVAGPASVFGSSRISPYKPYDEFCSASFWELNG